VLGAEQRSALLASRVELKRLLQENTELRVAAQSTGSKPARSGEGRQKQSAALRAEVASLTALVKEQQAQERDMQKDHLVALAEALAERDRSAAVRTDYDGLQALGAPSFFDSASMPTLPTRPHRPIAPHRRKWRRSTP
jgi:hypothetical protein